MITVVGGTGFIGRHLVKSLKSAVSQPVLSVGRTGGDLEIDLTDPAEIRRIPIKDGDIIYHLAAAIPSRVAPSFARMVQVNAGGTQQLLERLKLEQLNVRVIMLSSASVYGRHRDQHEFPETTALKPTDLYGLSKKMQLDIAGYYSRAHGLKIISLIVPSVYGPGQHPNVLSGFMSKARLGGEIEIWGSGSRSQDFLYINDLTEALVKVGTRTEFKSGIFNIGSGKETSLIELAFAIKFVLGKDVTCRFIPLPEADETRFKLDITKAVSELGYEPKYGLVEGLKDYVWQQVTDNYGR